MSFSSDGWLATRWPTTVVRDRYGGVYSGGTWVAFPLRSESVPSAVAALERAVRDGDRQP